MPKPGGLFKLAFFFLTFDFVQFPAPAIAQVVREKGEIRDGKREGLWEFYYPDGKLMARENYSGGRLHGRSVSFYPDGVIAQTENWENDLLEDSAFYFHPNGRLHRRGIYRAAMYEGLWLTWYPDGRPEQAGTYRHGLPEGEFTNWFPNGNRKETGRYQAGKQDGQFVFYTEGRKELIELLAQYCSGVPCGVWVWYDKKGRPRTSGPPPAQK